MPQKHPTLQHLHTSAQPQKGCPVSGLPPPQSPLSCLLPASHNSPPPSSSSLPTFPGAAPHPGLPPSLTGPTTPPPPATAEDAPATAAPGLWLRFQDGGRRQPPHACAAAAAPAGICSRHARALRMRSGHTWGRQGAVPGPETATATATVTVQGQCPAPVPEGHVPASQGHRAPM